MIPLRELRIGNLVQKGGALHVVQENDFLQVNNFEPVEITWQMFVQLGFDYLRSPFSTPQKYCRKRGLDVITYDDKSKVSHYSPVDNGTYGTPIKSLSHFQNLYFFMNGTELDISSLLKARQ